MPHSFGTAGKLPNHDARFAVNRVGYLANMAETRKEVMSDGCVTGSFRTFC
jgi:hypothetical protein